MSQEEILAKIAAISATKIQFAVVDIDGILRGKTICWEKFRDIAEVGTGFCNVVFGWDANDACYDNAQVSGWQTGFPDATATLDLASHRNLSWEGGTDFFFADFERAEGGLRDVCPRNLLKKIRKTCLEMGFWPRFGTDYEWFNFQRDDQNFYRKKYGPPRTISPGMFGYSLLRLSQNAPFFNEMFDELTRSGIPIEGLHTETGPGVMEAAIHRTEVLEAADRAVLFKLGVKSIAHRHGILSSFMAKWNASLPGCSGHLHQSLWDEAGMRNLFHAENSSPSLLMRQYIAGQLHCLPYILPMYAPTVNSYKRLVPGSWASTTVSWGFENRTTALRAICGKHDTARLETRVPGADANPYLAMAAALASGLYGIRQKLELNIAPTDGNEYENLKNEKLPTTLFEATAAMKNSDISKKLFGEKFTDHFIRTREWEWEKYSKAVTDWELARYFEII